MHFTDEQRRAIEARGTNILLSAAAGSGKTTVLVERVLELIASGGTRIDRMLIVTFTRAASSDMRAKLTQELGRRSAAGDGACREQLLVAADLVPRRSAPAQLLGELGAHVRGSRAGEGDDQHAVDARLA